MNKPIGSEGKHERAGGGGTPARARLWTTSRRVLGNLIPFLVALPFAGVGVWRTFVAKATYGEGMAWFFFFVVALWFSVNFLGLVGNAAMKRAMRRRMEASIHPNELPKDPFFVGFARPSFHSALDPHEDVGFVLLHDDRIEFFGDADRITVPKSCLQRVELRSNPHSWAFLGGWVSVEGVLEGKPVRMLLEPREKSTLLGNRGLRKGLKARIEGWRGG